MQDFPRSAKTNQVMTQALSPSGPEALRRIFFAGRRPGTLCRIFSSENEVDFKPGDDSPPFAVC